MDASPVTGGRAGLSTGEARERQKRSGLNRITRPYEITVLGIAKEEITEPMILLLLAVGVFYTILSNLSDALTLYAIIITLVLVEIANEYPGKEGHLRSRVPRRTEYPGDPGREDRRYPHRGGGAR